MTGRSFALGIVITAIVCAVGGRWTSSPPKGLPAPVLEATVRHEVQSVRDTALERQLLEARDRSQKRELAAAAARLKSDSVAAREHHRADSLEAIARVAGTARDSAEAWRIAYEVRTTEARDLEYSRDSARAETREAKVQLAAADSTGAIWKTHALRGDSLITRLVPLAQRAGDECRIAGFIHCPSRKQTAIAAVIGTIAAGIALRER